MTKGSSLLACSGDDDELIVQEHLRHAQSYVSSSCILRHLDFRGEQTSSDTSRIIMTEASNDTSVGWIDFLSH